MYRLRLRPAKFEMRDWPVEDLSYRNEQSPAYVVGRDRMAKRPLLFWPRQMS